MATPDVRVRLSAEGQKEIIDAFRKVQAEAEKSGKKPTQAFSGLNNTLRSTQRLLGAVGVTFGAITAVRGIQRGINAVKEWEKSWAEVRTIISGTDEEVAALERRVRGLANIVPQDQSLLAKGFYQTISSGITDSGEALHVLESASRAASAGVTDVFHAVDVGTTILNAFGKDVSEIDRVYDVLFTTVREGKITFEELAGSIGRAIPIAAQIGVPLEEVTAALATLTKGGFNAEEAVTALRATFLAVVKPGAEAEARAKQLGLEFSAEAVAAKGLVPFLAEVEEKTGGNARAIAELFPNVRGLNGVLALAGKQWEEYARILDVTENKSSGAVLTAFDKINSTLAAQEQLVRNRLKNAWLDLGNTIGGVVRSGLTAAGSLLPQSFEEQAETLGRLRRQIQEVDTRGQELADTYKRLVLESDGSEEAQQRVNQAMQDLADLFPEVIVRTDEYGKAVQINTERLIGYEAALQRTLDAQARLTFKQVNEDLVNHQKQLKIARDAYSSTFNALGDLQKGLREKITFGELLTPEQAQALGIHRLIFEQLSEDDVREILNRARVAVATLVQDVRGDQLRITKDVLDAGLAEAALQFDALAKEVEKGDRPVSDLADAVDNLDQGLIAILQTADPEEVRKKIGEVVAAIQAVDPNLSILGPLSGPQIEGAAGDAKKALDDQANVVRTSLNQELQIIRANAKLREAEEKRSFDQGLLGVQEYYSRRRRILEEQARAEKAALEQERDALAGETDPTKRKEKAAKIDSQLAQVRLRLEGEIKDLIVDEAETLAQLGEDRLAIEQRVLEAQGQRHEAALAAIDQEVRKADLLFRQLGFSDQRRQAELDRIRQALTGALDFETTKARAQAALQDLEALRARILAEANAGLITQTQAEQRLLDLENRRVGILRQLAQELSAAAAATGDPEKIAQARAFAAAVDGIELSIRRATATTEAFANTLEDSALRNLTDFFDSQAAGARNLGAAFRDMVRSIIADLRRLSSELLAAAIVKQVANALSSSGAGTLPAGTDVAAILQNFAGGGHVGGVGTGTSDSNLALISKGEYVVREAVVRDPAVLEHLEDLNRQGRRALVQSFSVVRPSFLPRFADGGLVGAGGGGRGADSEGLLRIALEEGLVLKILRSPAAQRIQVENAAKNRRGYRSALGT